MIAELLIGIFWNILKLMPFDIPPLPDTVEEYISLAFDYMAAGAGIVANYAPLDYMLSLLGILISIDIAIGIVHLVIWIYKKIPVFGGE